MAEQGLVRRTFVLVHGMNRGGWCYDRVAERLRAKGHVVFTPTLSGLAGSGIDDGRAINLTSHIRDIVDLVRYEELDDVVLCGHSYGGMVISGVVEIMPERIANLVFIDAIIPEDGKSMADYLLTPEMLPGVVAAVGQAGGGLMLPPPPDLAERFGVNEADRERVNRRCSPHPFASIIEKIRMTERQREVRHRTYIRASAWRSPLTAPHFERASGEGGWALHEIATGHDIMTDAPDELAEILCGLNAR